MAKRQGTTSSGKLRRRLSHLKLAIFLFPFAMPCKAFADQVIMKDGTVYKGKILIDTDKAILIGNPPFDPNSYLLESKDIDKIIYEEYHPNPPAERKRGFMSELHLLGDFYSSNELSLKPAAGLYGGLGFRVHPAFEINGGMEWMPYVAAKNGLLVTNGTEPSADARMYEKFWSYSATVFGRIYPFYRQKWKTEPYFMTGYQWAHLIPKGSGDGLSGSGWRVGAGAIRPLTTHLFLDGRFLYASTSYDQIKFLGHEGSIRPEVGEHQFLLSVGLSYRL